MLMIRLSRIGKEETPLLSRGGYGKDAPAQRSFFVEIVGTYDPIKSPALESSSITSEFSTG